MGVKKKERTSTVADMGNGPRVTWSFPIQASSASCFSFVQQAKEGSRNERIKGKVVFVRAETSEGRQFARQTRTWDKQISPIASRSHPNTHGSLCNSFLFVSDFYQSTAAKAGSCLSIRSCFAFSSAEKGRRSLTVGASPLLKHLSGAALM